MAGPANERVEQIAGELIAVLGTGTTVEPYSKRFAGFDLSEAYAIAERVRELREKRGERAVGRKIGFTNRAVQKTFGVAAPIWNYMFDTTVGDLATSPTFALTGTCAARIEPEILLHLASAPRVGMSEAELAGCVDWVAHGFEIVDAIFLNWSFAASDAIAGYGVHAALLMGAKRTITDNRTQWAEQLARFTITLKSSDGVTRTGSGANVLDSPLIALKFLVEEIARYPHARPLQAGEIITTGTLTDAMPVSPGQTWSTELAGIRLDGIAVEFR
jgi:2-oxo-3-hexenedioate decarboxylase